MWYENQTFYCTRCITTKRVTSLQCPSPVVERLVDYNIDGRKVNLRVSFAGDREFDQI